MGDKGMSGMKEDGLCGVQFVGGIHLFRGTVKGNTGVENKDIKLEKGKKAGAVDRDSWSKIYRERGTKEVGMKNSASRRGVFWALSISLGGGDGKNKKC